MIPDVTVAAVTTPFGVRLRLRAARYVPDDCPDDDGAVALDRDEVAELRDVCEEFLLTGRVP